MATKNSLNKLQQIASGGEAEFNIFDRGRTAEEPSAKKKRKKVPITSLVENKMNGFFVDDNEDLEELAGAIQEDGISNTIEATEQPDGTYRILSGHRRFLAAKKAGVETVEIWALPPLSASDEIAFMTRENIGGRGDDPFGKARMILYYAKAQEEIPKEERVPALTAFKMRRATYFQLSLLAANLPEDILVAGQQGLLTKELALTLAKLIKEHPTLGKRMKEDVQNVIASDKSKDEKIKEIKDVITAREKKPAKEKKPKKVNAYKNYQKAASLITEAFDDENSLPTKPEQREELKEICTELLDKIKACLEKL